MLFTVEIISLARKGVYKPVVYWGSYLSIDSYFHIALTSFSRNILSRYDLFCFSLAASGKKLFSVCLTVSAAKHDAIIKG